MWQPRFGHCCLGRFDCAGVFFVPLIQIDQRYFHKTHYLSDPTYKAWIDRLSRSKVHPAFRDEFDEYSRTNHTASGNGEPLLPLHVESFWRAVPAVLLGLVESRVRRMEINPKNIRINRYYLGPGKGSAVEAVYLPTGVSVAECIPAGSTEIGRTLHARLLSALKLKIQE